jgi:hypothetical protein
MRYLKKIMLALACVPLGGCASLVTAWKNDPLQAYDVKNPTLYAMTGDRRTAVVVAGADGRNRFCAESLPDAVAAFSATSKAAAALDTRGSASFEERAIAGLLQTFQRTESAELYRQMGWNACLAWVQGGITNEEYFRLLNTMTERGMSAISTRASQPLQPVAFHNGYTVDPGRLSGGDGNTAGETGSEEPEGTEEKAGEKKTGSATGASKPPEKQLSNKGKGGK